MPDKRTRLEQQLQDHEEHYRRLAAKLAETGYLHDGSVGRQWLTCGKASCACASDPKRKHGPYGYWTTKHKGRTVSRRLSPEETELLESWVANRRQLERTRQEMIRISKKVKPIILELRALERASSENTAASAARPGQTRPLRQR